MIKKNVSVNNIKSFALEMVPFFFFLNTQNFGSFDQITEISRWWIKEKTDLWKTKPGYDFIMKKNNTE